MPTNDSVPRTFPFYTPVSEPEPERPTVTWTQIFAEITAWSERFDRRYPKRLQTFRCGNQVAT